MTLQSQSPRVSGWRVSPRKPRTPMYLGGAAAVVAGGLLVYLWVRAGSAQAAPGAQDLAPASVADRASPVSVAPGVPASVPVAPPRVETKAHEPAVLELSTGRMRAQFTPVGASTSSAPSAPTSPGTPPSVSAPASTPAPAASQPVRAAEPVPAPSIADLTSRPRTLAMVDPLKPASEPRTAPGASESGAAASTQPVVTGPGVNADTSRLVAQGMSALSANRLVEARTALNAALWDAQMSPGDRAKIRDTLGTINQTLVFAPRVEKDDPLAEVYAVKTGDNPTLVMRRQNLPVDRLLLQRVNNLGEGKGLRVGQSLKIFRTPFHAVVHKVDHRMDLYMGPPVPTSPSPSRRLGPDAQEEGWTFIRSLPVGLGESNGTPEGLFVIRPASKLINPKWKNPRTGEVFEANDPKNPIGEHWLGLEGVDENTRSFTGYGIHGTIDPDSVGKNMSMGCVRLRPDDVALVYELLVEKVSTVKIVQ